MQYPGCQLCRPTCDLFMPSPSPPQQAAAAAFAGSGGLGANAMAGAGGYGIVTNYPNHPNHHRPGVLGGDHDVELPAESDNMDAIVQVGYLVCLRLLPRPP